MYSTSIELWELLVAPLYLVLAAAICLVYPRKEDRFHFTLGMTARISGGIMYTLIYLYYYGGGDTTAYFNTALPFLNLLLAEPVVGFRVLLEPFSIENLSVFTDETGFPYRYIYADRSTFTVSRIIIPFLFFGFKSYFLTTILFSTITYFGIWKLYELFRYLVPDGKQLALFSALLFPSVLFWSSGISKDAITYTSVCYVVYGFYFTVIAKQFNTVRITLSIIGAFFIILIKPYIFLILFPGALLWIFNSRIQRIKNRILRFAIVPFVAVITVLIFAFTFSNLSDVLGDYSADNILQKALITQDDLKRDYYGGNTFDIGEIDPTIVGVLSKFPIATFFGFFGPTLIHVNNAVMLFSALENTFLLMLTLGVFVFRNPTIGLRRIINNPFLSFCMLFSIFLAFAIGFTTPNFGALVRFKIPLIPFFCFALLCLYYRKEIIDSTQK